jgi:hypothetical protein
MCKTGEVRKGSRRDEIENKYEKTAADRRNENERGGQMKSNRREHRIRMDRRGSYVVFLWLHSCFIFGMSQVQFSEDRLSILSKDFVVFLKSAKNMLEGYMKVSHHCFLPYPLQFTVLHYHPIR